MHILKVETLLSSTSSSFHLLFISPLYPTILAMAALSLCKFVHGKSQGTREAATRTRAVWETSWWPGPWCSHSVRDMKVLLRPPDHHMCSPRRLWPRLAQATSIVGHSMSGPWLRGDNKRKTIDGDAAPVTQPWLIYGHLFRKKQHTVRMYGWHVVHRPTNSPGVRLK